MTMPPDDDRSRRARRAPLLTRLARRLGAMNARTQMIAHLDRLDERTLRDMGVSRVALDAMLHR